MMKPIVEAIQNMNIGLSRSLFPYFLYGIAVPVAAQDRMGFQNPMTTSADLEAV